MGKKRQKMKELSVAIAESSSIQGTETAQPEIQPQAPRKRGRPRKIIVVESEEKKIQATEKEAAAAASTAAQGTDSSVKKEGQSTACISVNTKEEDIQLPKGEPSRSRARRKSKPRKST